MKLYKSLFFILSLLALLGLIAFFFPEGGLNIGPAHLDFPTLNQALTPSEGLDADADNKEAVLSPEEQLAMEMEALHAAQDSTFTSFCMTSPIRIAMPHIHHVLADTITYEEYAMMSDSIRLTYDSIMPYVVDPLDTLWVVYSNYVTEDKNYLDSFFAALDSARSKHVRIIHYGDSQIEEDRISSGLREHFQERFGGGGCGMLPGQQWITRLTCSQSTSPELQRHLCFGANQGNISSRRYGPMAVVAHAYGNARISVKMTENPKYSHVREFNRITVMRDVPGSDQVQFIVQDFDEMQSRAVVNIDGPADIFGVMFDQKTGVSVDNVPMRGSSGNVFTKIARSTFEPFYKHENVQLIILQYGGNMVPGLGNEQKMHRLCAGLQQQVKYFREIAPEAKFLFIGPSDMATKRGGIMQTYSNLPRFVELLEEYMTECGVAFWNMYEAMGGEGSMVQWVKARPQLAGEDYIHFTHKGAEKMSDLLYETIDTYYKYYKFRNGELELNNQQDNEDTPNDSICPVDTVGSVH